MKNFKVPLLVLISFFVGMNLTHAVCSTTEANRLNSLATKVSVSYELKEKEVIDEERLQENLTEEELEYYKYKLEYYTIYINNITEDLYVKVYDNFNNETKTYTYADAKNGVISFDLEQITNSHKYDFSVYGSDKTGECQDKLYRNLSLTTPYFNSMSETTFCDGISEFFLCHRYLDIPYSYSLDDVERLTTEYKSGTINDEGEELQPEEKNNFFKDHKTEIIIISSIIVIFGGLITVILLRNKGDRKNEKNN